MPSPTYEVRIDWDGTGDFTAGADNVTSRRRADGGLSIQYGRDHARASAPTSPGQASFTLDNASRDYSPENASSPLVGKVLPARPVRVQATHLGTTYTLFRGQTDDFNVQPTPGQRVAAITCLDGLAALSGVDVTVALRGTVRTGTAIGYILDAAGWSATARDLDPGATIIPWYWEEGTDALGAIQKLIAAEGMPSFISIDPDGNFMFRDRHHRLTRSASLTSQVTFRDKGADPRFSWPLNYDHGWKDIVNTIRIEVTERSVKEIDSIWSSDSTYAIADGQTIQIEVSTSDPFINAVTPTLAEEDFTVASGVVSVTMSVDGGASAVLSVKAVGGPAVLTSIRIRGNPISSARTRVANLTEAASQSAYGKRSPDDLDATWLTYEDALAVAATMLAHRAQRLPIVSIRLTGGNDTIMTQQLIRDLSDRVTIVDAETGLNAGFYIERIEHSITGAGSQMHETVFACEKAPVQPTGLFTFDKAGAGFNDGVFALIGMDDPTTIMRFDVSGHGFNQGTFAT